MNIGSIGLQARCLCLQDSSGICHGDRDICDRTTFQNYSGHFDEMTDKASPTISDDYKLPAHYDQPDSQKMENSYAQFDSGEHHTFLCDSLTGREQLGGYLTSLEHEGPVKCPGMEWHRDQSQLSEMIESEDFKPFPSLPDQQLSPKCFLDLDFQHESKATHAQYTDASKSQQDINNTSSSRSISSVQENSVHYDTSIDKEHDIINPNSKIEVEWTSLPDCYPYIRKTQLFRHTHTFAGSGGTCITKLASHDLQHGCNSAENQTPDRIQMDLMNGVNETERISPSPEFSTTITSWSAVESKGVDRTRKFGRGKDCNSSKNTSCEQADLVSQMTLVVNSSPDSSSSIIPKGLKNRKRGCRLWEFIRNLLLDSATNPRLIRWENRAEGTFRLVQSKTIARIWGMQKGNGEMNYEKLSRAMRYYYKRQVFQPVIGKRLVYRFGPRATGWHEK